MPLSLIELRRAKHALGLVRRIYKQSGWRSKQRRGEPVTFGIQDGPRVRLYPEGHIPELLFVGGFEALELRLCARFLQPGMNVLDVGANVGLYSILASRIVSPAGKVWSFEPSSETAGRLRRNLELNGCSNVTVEQKALSSVAEGFLTLKRDPGFRDGDRYLLPLGSCAPGEEAAGNDPGDTEQVPITTVDAWAAENGAEASTIDFWKMDVEGGEFDVLRGAEQTLRRNPALVGMLECTREGCTRAGCCQRDVFDFLGSCGFKAYCVEAKHRRWTTDEQVLLAAGNVWVAADESRLPRI